MCMSDNHYHLSFALPYSLHLFYHQLQDLLNRLPCVPRVFRHRLPELPVSRFAEYTFGDDICPFVLHRYISLAFTPDSKYFHVPISEARENLLQCHAVTETCSTKPRYHLNHYQVKWPFQTNSVLFPICARPRRYGQW